MRILGAGYHTMLAHAQHICFLQKVVHHCGLPLLQVWWDCGAGQRGSGGRLVRVPYPCSAGGIAMSRAIQGGQFDWLAAHEVRVNNAE
jgi:hypothetical protein